MKVLAIFFAIATLVILATAGCSSKSNIAPQDNPAPVTNTDGIQKASITIDGGKYTPSVISVEKGKPVELTFVGGKELGCGGTIVFKSLEMSKNIESGKTVTFNFTPKEAGEIPFTCGMGMYQGKVVAK